MSAPEALARCRAILGGALVAHCVLLGDRGALDAWQRGEGGPPEGPRLRLLALDELLARVCAHEGQDTARAFLIGCDPVIGNRSPAAAIRAGDLDAARASADLFLAG